MPPAPSPRNSRPGTSTTLLILGYLAQAKGSPYTSSHPASALNSPLSLQICSRAWQWRLFPSLRSATLDCPSLWYVPSLQHVAAFPFPFLFCFCFVSCHSACSYCRLSQISILYLMTFGFWVLPDTGSGMLGQAQKVRLDADIYPPSQCI